MGAATGMALVEALHDNCSIVEVQVPSNRACTDAIAKLLTRNRELVSAWQALAALARCGHLWGFRTLTGNDFRASLLSFFMAPGCTATPRFFGTAASRRCEVCTESVPVPAGVGAGISNSLPSVQAVAAHVAVAAEQVSRDEVEQEVKTVLAMTQDEEELLNREADDLAMALQLSKADLIQEEELSLLRLVKHARSPQVVQALLEAPELELCRQRASEVCGCLRPEWAGGAWLLAPLSESELFALMEKSENLVLRDWHVLIRRRDEHFLRQALGNSSILKEAEGFLEVHSERAEADSDVSMQTDAAEAAAAEKDLTFDVTATLDTWPFTVERTFFAARDPNLAAANSSDGPRSAPF